MGQMINCKVCDCEYEFKGGAYALCSSDCAEEHKSRRSRVYQVLVADNRKKGKAHEALQLIALDDAASDGGQPHIPNIVRLVREPRGRTADDVDIVCHWQQVGGGLKCGVSVPNDEDRLASKVPRVD